MIDRVLGVVISAAVIAGAGLAGILVTEGRAGALTTLVVTRTDDPANDANCTSGVDCSLRQAFNAASTNGDDTTIVLQPGATYNLDFSACTADQLEYTGSNLLTVDGNGATISQQCPGARVIEQSSGLMTLDGVTIRDGNFNTTGLEFGGAVDAVDTLTITNSRFVNNSVNSTVETRGGAIFVSGNVTITNTMISDSSATSANSVEGGAVAATGRATLIGSTVVNSTAGAGEGAEVFGGAVNADTLDVSMTRSTISNTVATAGDAVFGGAVDGNGVAIESSTIHDTAVTGDDVLGGVINSGLVGTVALRESSIQRASVGANSVTGGAVLATSLTMQSSTIGETSSVAAGGTVHGGAAQVETAEITNSTISDNRAVGTGGSFGGAIDAAGTVTLVYSTIAGNTAAQGTNLFIDGANLQLVSFGSVIALGGGGDCAGGFLTTSHGYNFDGDGSCGFGSGPGDHPAGGDPKLGPLGANGGSTPTRLPATDSALVDAIPVSDCQGDGAAGIATDQRGVARPQRAGCDIGAVELEAVPPVPPGPGPAPVPAAPVAGVVPRFTG